MSKKWPSYDRFRGELDYEDFGAVLAEKLAGLYSDDPEVVEENCVWFIYWPEETFNRGRIQAIPDVVDHLCDCLSDPDFNAIADALSIISLFLFAKFGLSTSYHTYSSSEFENLLRERAFAHWSTFVGFLNDPSLNVRRDAASLLSEFDDSKTWTELALWVSREPDEELALEFLNTLIARLPKLAILSKIPEVLAAAEQFANSNSRKLRVLGNLSLANAKASTSTKEFEELVDEGSVEPRQGFDESFCDWCHGYLSHLINSLKLSATTRWLTNPKLAASSHAGRFFRILVRMHCTSRYTPVDPEVRKLILSGIVGCDAFWRDESRTAQRNRQSLFRQVGCPATRDGIVEYLAMTEGNEDELG